jgi:hypothetical protein
MSKKIVVVFALSVLLLTGCVHLTQGQMDLYREMVAAGEPVSGYPNMAVAGAMSVLPGGGQFYNGQVGLGILNVIFWPLSYLWAIPSAILDAKAIRVYRNVERYKSKKR